MRPYGPGTFTVSRPSSPARIWDGYIFVQQEGEHLDQPDAPEMDKQFGPWPPTEARPWTLSRFLGGRAPPPYPRRVHLSVAMLRPSLRQAGWPN